MSIVDLQNKYNFNGSLNANNGKSVIEQQKEYIAELKNLINLIGRANNSDCLTGINGLNDVINMSRAGECNNIRTSILANPVYTKAKNIAFTNSFTVSNSPVDSTNYNSIMETNREIRKLRSELDLKLKDLNRTSDSRFKSDEDIYNYELMMNITWSILATSIIYYVFVKL